MIETLFATHVLVKDFPEYSESWTNTIKGAVKAHFAENSMKEDAQRSKSHSTRLFSEDNMNSVPELRELRGLMLGGFQRLASSYPQDHGEEYGDSVALTDEAIAELTGDDLGRLPIVQQNQRMAVHNHTNTEAFAIFYLQDIDHAREGGQLILHDPSWHHMVSMYNTKTHAIDARRNRLVVVPGHVWHEVTPYHGEQRLNVVLNMRQPYLG